MSRSARQSRILSLISVQDIGSQEELVAQLRYEGFEVTQATVSRDIKELGLIKTLTDSNKYKYTTKGTMDNRLSAKLLNVVREAVVTVVTAENIVVVKTFADSACAVSSALEQLNLPEVVGIVADRSTVLVVCSHSVNSPVVAQKIKELL